MNRALAIATFLLAGMPMLATAQTIQPLQNAVAGLFEIAQSLLPVVFTLALLFFFWGVIKFIFNVSKGEDSATAGRGVLFWGVVALFVMASIWGIVGFLQEIFGIEGGGIMDVPGIDRGNTGT